MSETEVADVAARQRPIGQRVTRLPACRQAHLDAMVASQPALARHRTVAELLDPSPYELQVLQREARLSIFGLATGSLRFV